MVTRRWTYSLLQVIWQLSYVHERCRSAASIAPTQLVAVKSENHILAALRPQVPVLAALARQFEALKPTVRAMEEWIAYLDKKYAEEWVLFGPPFKIDYHDAERLAEDSRMWMSAVSSVFADSGTVLIKEESLQAIFPEQLLSKLDSLTKEDLLDAFRSIMHLEPTPAAMVCLRAAENMVRTYHAKLKGEPASGKSWAEILKELEENHEIKAPLLGYLRYLKEKRNEAEHPDKRFSQEEAERMFLQVKGLLVELQGALG